MMMTVILKAKVVMKIILMNFSENLNAYFLILKKNIFYVYNFN